MEMINVLAAIRVWAKRWASMQVTIKCDNAAVVQVVNTGITRDSMLVVIARNIWLVSALNNIQLKLIYLPGTLNKSADLYKFYKLIL